MAVYDPRVDAYIEKAAPFAQPILIHLRQLIHDACPEVEETWKWSFPNFVYRGAVIVSMAAFSKHCSFSFWKASIMPDPDGILTLTGREAMGHLGKISSLDDLPKDSVLKKYIKAAMKLNEEGKKVPVRAKVTEAEKQQLETPPDFAALLEGNKDAAEVFGRFSYTSKKEYIQWFNDAKTAKTRDKRMIQALEWIAEGKTRNWKYQKC